MNRTILTLLFILLASGIVGSFDVEDQLASTSKSHAEGHPTNTNRIASLSKE